MRASGEARDTREAGSPRRVPAVRSRSRRGRAPALTMKPAGHGSRSSPASRGRRSRSPRAREDSAEAAGERLRQLNIGEGDNREHNRMIRSQYRELISTVQRKEPARGEPRGCGWGTRAGGGGGRS